MSSKIIKKLNRFTSLPILLDLLQRKKLTLLDPVLWEDKNDSEIILEYRKKKSVKKLFVLCFTHGDETVHHWKTYSNGVSGCCIEFNAQELFNIIDSIYGLKHGEVEYKKIIEIEKKKVSLDKMPFTKRWPYRCEEEYRIVVETDSDSNFFDIDIPLDLINRITISQQMPKQIYKTIKSYLINVKGYQDSKINKSTLYENIRWINCFKNVNKK